MSLHKEVAPTFPRPLKVESHDASNHSKTLNSRLSGIDEQGAGQGISPAPCLDAGPRWGSRPKCDRSVRFVLLLAGAWWAVFLWK